ncbi:unnamed protein product [Scytosiphon promiscuus]
MKRFLHRLYCRCILSQTDKGLVFQTARRVERFGKMSHDQHAWRGAAATRMRLRSWPSCAVKFRGKCALFTSSLLRIDGCDCGTQDAMEYHDDDGRKLSSAYETQW